MNEASGYDDDGYGCSYNYGNGCGSGCDYRYGYDDGSGNGYGSGHGHGNSYGNGYGSGYEECILFYTKPFIAYHYISKNKFIRYMKNIKAEVGLVLEMNEDPILCKKGFHASMKPDEAKMYLPDGILTKVECGGKVVFGTDKLVCTKRKILEIYVNR